MAKKRKGKKRGRKRLHSMHKSGFAGPVRKRGRPTGTKKRKKAKKKHSSGKIPETVIRKFANKLKKNKRAADIYRDVLGC